MKALRLRKSKQQCLDHPELLQLLQMVAAVQAEQWHRKVKEDTQLCSNVKLFFAILTVKHKQRNNHISVFFSY